MKATDDEIRDLARRLASLLEHPEPGLISWLGLRAEVAGKLREALADRTGEGRPAGPCRDCRHWGGPGEARPFRTCQAVREDRDHTTSELAYDEDEWLNTPGEVGAREAWRAARMAVLSVGTVGTLRTRQDFGCVLFEGKEGP